MAKKVKVVVFSWDLSYRYKRNRNDENYSTGHFYINDAFIKNVLEKFYETYGNLECLQITNINAGETYRDENFY